MFENSALRVLENGERLLDDAEDLFDREKYPTSFALAIIAQEEFSKAFIFHLISKDILKWNPFIKRAVKDHHSKQLIGLVLDLLSPPNEDILNLLVSGKYEEYYRKAFDAIQILRYQKFDRRESSNHTNMELQDFHKDSISILKGKLEKEKQDSIYVKISQKGEVIFDPNLIDEIRAQKMIYRAQGFAAINRVVTNYQNFNSPDYEEIKAAFKNIFNEFI